MGQIYLTGSVARGIRRMARQGSGVKLAPSEVRTVEPHDLGRVTLSSLGLDELRMALGVSQTKRVDLLVGSAGDRIRANGIKCHVCSRPLPACSFDVVQPLEGALGISLPSDATLYVETPQLAFLMTAASLSRLVKRGNMSAQEADLRLAKLGIEDCSTYVLDPRRPLEAECSYGKPALMTADELRSYLSEAHGMEGLGMARRASKLVFNRSGSQMETFLHSGIAYPLNMGGFALSDPAANKRIQLTELQRRILNHVDHLTPDLLWEELRIVLEYLGEKPHEGAGAKDEDTGRIQDFEALGYRAMPVRYRHVRTVADFGKLVMRLALIMEERGVKGCGAWVSDLCADREFLARQATLFKVMLPAVRDR